MKQHGGRYDNEPATKPDVTASTQASYLQAALAIAASSYPSPLTKYEIVSRGSSPPANA